MPLLGHFQPAKPEKTRAVGSVTGLHQVRHDLAHHTTKLEAVSREPVSNEDLEDLRMAVQYKVHPGLFVNTHVLRAKSGHIFSHIASALITYGCLNRFGLSLTRVELCWER